MQALRRFFADKALELIIAGVCLQLASTAVTAWLASPFIMLMSALAILVLLGVFVGVKELRERRKRPPGLDNAPAFKVPRKGIIFTLGLNSDKQDSVVYLVMNELKPKVVGFLGTPETDAANIVTRICSTMNLQPGKYKSESWTPAERTSIHEGKVKTSLIIDWMLGQDLNESDIVLDLTGGTATMSIAAFMAADERRVDCQYIYSQFDRSKNLRIPGSEKPTLITRYE